MPSPPIAPGRNNAHSPRVRFSSPVRNAATSAASSSHMFVYPQAGAQTLDRFVRLTAHMARSITHVGGRWARFPCRRCDCHAAAAHPQPQFGLVVGLVGVQLAGRRRRSPRRDRTAGTAFTRNLSDCESWTLTAETATARGIPARSDNMRGFEPGFPRSVGFRPVRSPPFRPHRRRVKDRPRPVDLPADAAAATPRHSSTL